MLFKQPLVLQHSLQKLNRKLATSVKTLSMRGTKAAVPATLHLQKNPDQVKTRFVPAAA